MHSEMHSEIHTEMHSEMFSKLLYKIYISINFMQFFETDHVAVALETKVGACDVAACAHRMLLFDKCV